MRFKTRGTFATEHVIDLAQRIVAQCQDAGVDYVTGLNFYLTAADETGKHKRFVLDGLEIDHVDVECWDLAVAEPQSQMSAVYTHEPANGLKPSSKAPRRTYGKASARRRSGS